MSNKNFCLFCSIQKEKEKIIYEDDYIFVIHDIQKASAIEHILVCSKEHLVSVLHLNKNHIPLILLMKQKALKVLDELNEKGKYRLGFHFPPLILINHLHLHGFVEPLSSNVFNLLYKPEVLLLSPNKVCDILKTDTTVGKYLLKKLFFLLLMVSLLVIALYIIL